MENDDEMVGRILTRREVLALFGATGATLLVGCGTSGGTAATVVPGSATLNAEARTAVAIEGAPTTQAVATAQVATVEAGNAGAVPACVVHPQQTEGPYFVDERLNRSDIRADPESGAVKAGIPLLLTFNISQVAAQRCTPLAGAVVDVWHCDAEGAYSDVTDSGVGFDTVGEKWLRGYQVSDANGQAIFQTIFPGWYSGRTVHIHFKVRTDPDSEQGQEFTSQLFFDKAVADEVFAQEPYAAKGEQDTLNSTDNIYHDLLLLTTAKTDEGYAATFDLGIDWSVVSNEPAGGPNSPPLDGRPGGPRPDGPPPNGASDSPPPNSAPSRPRPRR